MKTAFAAVALVLFATLAGAQTIAARDGWVTLDTDKPYVSLVADVIAATKATGMGVVTQAGPTKAAKSRGIVIPGNRVIGIFNNHFAVRVLATSTAAMIEAPIRMYVTENPDGTATLSYKTPSHVFAPYLDEGGAVLADLATTLDAKFTAIADMAVK
jgi:uncharacterized protein (DUF302 family)